MYFRFIVLALCVGEYIAKITIILRNLLNLKKQCLKKKEKRLST